MTPGESHKTVHSLEFSEKNVTATFEGKLDRNSEILYLNFSYLYLEPNNWKEKEYVMLPCENFLVAKAIFHLI